MVVDQQTLKVMRAFGRYVKSNALSEIASYSLKELQRADEVLGHRDLSADFRIALRGRIEDLKEEEKKNIKAGYGLFSILSLLPLQFLPLF